VVKADPFDGPITLLVDESRQVIGANVAHYVLVAASDN
jgi:Fe2+ transport system protein FeoA